MVLLCFASLIVAIVASLEVVDESYSVLLLVVLCCVAVDARCALWGSSL